MKVRSRPDPFALVDELIEAVEEHTEVTDDLLQLPPKSPTDTPVQKLQRLDVLITLLIQMHGEAEAAQERAEEAFLELKDTADALELKLLDLADADLTDDAMQAAQYCVKQLLQPYLDQVHSGTSYDNLPVDELDAVVSTAIQVWVDAKLAS